MTHASDLPNSLSGQAAHWWVLLHGDGASGAEHREFGEWVAKSPERVEAYLQMAKLMRALNAGTVRWPDTPVDELTREARERPAYAALPFRGAPSRLHAEAANETGKFRTWRSSGATGRPFHLGPRPLTAAVGSVAIAAALSWFMLAGPQVYTTKFGEQRSVLLDDGSRVTLNTASRIDVELRKKRRLIHLIEGEAFFEVAHDAARPFDVQAGGTVLRAVGTQFNVYMRPTGTTVTVVEGRVAVVPEAEAVSSIEAPSALPANASGPQIAAPKDALILAVADRLVITNSQAGVPQHISNVAAATSWTQRQFVFDKRPLSEVADEFNRYNRDRIVIDSDELRGQEVSGVFQSNDPASFLSFLSGIQGVEIRRGKDGSRLVSARKDGGDKTLRSE